jgi:hypothetical protein
MRIGGTETAVLIATSGIVLSVLTSLASHFRRARYRRRLTRALELNRLLPPEGAENLRAVLGADVRDCAGRLERMHARTIMRRRARSGGAFALVLVVGAAGLAALALPAPPSSRTRPVVLSVAAGFALIALLYALRRDARFRARSVKRAGESTDPLPTRRPTLLAIWRWFPSGFSSSVDQSEDTITARVSPPAAGADLHWRQEAFPMG